MRHEHLVRHDRAGAKHLRTPHGNPFAILIDDLQHRIVIAELARGFGAINLWINNDVREEQIIVTGVNVIVPIDLGPITVMGLEQVAPHQLACDGGCQMIRRAAHETTMLFRPKHQRFAPLHQILIGFGHLPGPVHAPPVCRRFEGHCLCVRGISLVIVKTGSGLNGIAKSWMFRRVVDQLAFNIDGAVILQARDMLGGVLDRLGGHREPRR